MGLDLEPAWYLMGRDDGGIEPFYARYEMCGHWACGAQNELHLLTAITSSYEGWWFEVQAIPSEVPECWPTADEERN